MDRTVSPTRTYVPIQKGNKQGEPFELPEGYGNNSNQATWWYMGTEGNPPIIGCIAIEGIAVLPLPEENEEEYSETDPRAIDLNREYLEEDEFYD